MKWNSRDNMPAFPGDQLFLERPRIHGLLAKAMESPAVFICAGEGFGKTYAVSSFLRRRPDCTTIWVQLSDRDNNPWRFWENYTKAMGRCKPGAGKELRDIGFPETARQFSRWYEIARRDYGIPGQYVIVGDDIHCLQAGPVRNFAEQAVRYTIPGHALIFISRTDPGINMASLLSKGLLTRLDAGELLFNEEECAAYFRLRNMELPREELAGVYRDTEGWPLALGLLATEIQKSGGHYERPLLERGAFKILEDDLFASVPVSLRSYLIKLSLFEQWPLELLERTAVVLPEQYRPGPEGNLSALLGELEKLGALIRYDYYLQGYRIHQVFLDYLREKQKELPAGEIKAISAIAAQWCLENNLKMDAAINFERAGDCAGLTAIVNSFPRIVPKIAAAALLDIVERLMKREDQNEADEHFINLRYVVRGRLLMCLARFDEAASVFMENIRHFEKQDPGPAGLRVLAESWSYMGSLFLITRRFDSSCDYANCFEKAEQYYRRCPFPLLRVMTLCNVSSYVTQISHPAPAGEFQRRIDAFSKGISRAAGSLSGFLSGMDDLARTEFAYYQADLDSAEQYARQTVIKVREQSQWEIESRALFFLLRITLHRGGGDDLLELWKQSEAMLTIDEYYNRSTITDIINGWIHTQLGKGKKTAPWLQNRFEESDLYSMFRNFESLVKAKFLFAEKRYAEAVDFLNLKENKNGLGSFLLGMVDMYCLEAAARFRMGEEQAALDILEDAYQAAAPNSLDMPFIELGHDMRGLASAALGAGRAIPRFWLEEIRSRASAYGKNLFAIAEQLREREDPAKVYLTRQERTVLKGLSRGQTREEIAAETGQSLGTVKSIISRACEKLGAVNRADAVRIAANLGLLGKR